MDVSGQVVLSWCDEWCPSCHQHLKISQVCENDNLHIVGVMTLDETKYNYSAPECSRVLVKLNGNTMLFDSLRWQSPFYEWWSPSSCCSETRQSMCLVSTATNPFFPACCHGSRSLPLRGHASHWTSAETFWHVSPKCWQLKDPLYFADRNHAGRFWCVSTVDN